MRAIILAGGKGSRLAPYTTILPKPLLPIGDKPILEIVIRQLAHSGFDDITLAVGYLAELVIAFCGDGSKFGVRLTYSREDTPLGTAGPIALVSEIQDTFLVMNGDLLSTVDYAAMLAYHRARGAIATLAAYRHDVKIDLGVVQADADGWLTNYVEKPTYHYDISSGIYFFEPSILSHIPRGEHLDLPELVLKLIRQGQKVGVYRFEGYWLDIGRPEDYDRAAHEFQVNRSIFLPED